MQLGVVVIEMCRGRGGGAMEDGAMGDAHVGISILLVLVPLGYLPCFIVISHGTNSGCYCTTSIAHIASINRHVRHRTPARESKLEGQPTILSCWPQQRPWRGSRGVEEVSFYYLLRATAATTTTTTSRMLAMVFLID